MVSSASGAAFLILALTCSRRIRTFSGKPAIYESVFTVTLIKGRVFLLLTITLKTLVVGSGAITRRYGNIQQAIVHAQLRPVMGNLVQPVTNGAVFGPFHQFLD